MPTVKLSQIALAPSNAGGTDKFIGVRGNTTDLQFSLSQLAAGLPGSSVTPAALTKVDDTNVTLTLSGTPATALLQATSITVGWTGLLSGARGGTGIAVAASPGGTTNFLRADGAWAVPPGAGVTPSALTKVDDTNVTLTLTGSPATALIAAAGITVGWTGVLGASRGGTGSANVAFIGPTAPRAFILPDANTTLASLTVADQTVSGGANVTAQSLTTGNITVDCGSRPLQFITNNGAFTITAPANDGSCMLLVTNGASAGAITFSGFSVGSNTGDALTTTNTQKFTVSIWRINGTSGYRIAAHQ
jgi:hypothetical protein